MSNFIHSIFNLFFLIENMNATNCLPFSHPHIKLHCSYIFLCMLEHTTHTRMQAVSYCRRLYSPFFLFPFTLLCLSLRRQTETNAYMTALCLKKKQRERHTRHVCAFSSIHHCLTRSHFSLGRCSFIMKESNDRIYSFVLCVQIQLLD